MVLTTYTNKPNYDKQIVSFVENFEVWIIPKANNNLRRFYSLYIIICFISYYQFFRKYYRLALEGSPEEGEEKVEKAPTEPDEEAIK